LKTLDGVVAAMSGLLVARDPYTAGHQKRVSLLVEAIGKRLGLKDDVLKGLNVAALIHDIGKISVPSEILSQPGRLSEIEFNFMKEHPQVGYDILKDIEFPWPVADSILQHHERLDGSGYPQGLRGKDIILEARILAVADVSEAMLSHRPYRPALNMEKLQNELKTGRTKRYDAKVVDACLKCFSEGFTFGKNG
jgi:putative nucleotidyltransferase with HDIG domain